MKDRLLSIDVLRGMTIFFMIVVNTPGNWEHVYAPLKHAKWDGLTPTDLVFPFFVFIVGMSMAFSFIKFNEADRTVWMMKVLKRTFMIYLVGLLLHWFPFYNRNIADLRLVGVLPRIALAYGLAGLAIIYLKERWLPYLLLALLIGYYALLMLFGGAEPLSLEHNAVRRLDLWLLGERHIYKGYGLPFDPEGLLSTLPAVGTVLCGYLLGRYVQKFESHQVKIIKTLPWAIGAISLGVLWNYVGFPINKPLWSSSYVLVTAGLAALLFCLLTYLIDVLGYIKWAYIFRVFGLNPLAAYALSGLVIKTFGLIKIGDHGLYGWLYQSFFQHIGSTNFGSLVQALAYTMFIWLFAWWMYRRQIIIKL